MNDARKAAVAVGIAGCLGIAVLGWRIEQYRAALAKSAPLSATVTQPGSFSEVENAKAALNALARDFILRVQALQVRDYLAGKVADSSARRAKTLKWFLAGFAEFQGTEAEPAVLKSMLDFLKTNGEPAPWMSLYLGFLYRRPSHPLVQALALDAGEMAAQCGRTGELKKAQAFIELIPQEAGRENTESLPVLANATGRADTLLQNSSTL